MEFELFQIMFFIAFFAVFGVIVMQLFQGMRQWNKNNHSPRLTVPATVVSKRTNVSRHHNAGSNAMSHTSTTYYATFQVESGDRMELAMKGYEYGLIVEGDRGNLTFQGTRFLGFERT